MYNIVGPSALHKRNLQPCDSAAKFLARRDSRSTDHPVIRHSGQRCTVGDHVEELGFDGETA